MIVVDASVMIAALVEVDDRGKQARRALAAAGRLCAPQHLPLEVVNTVRCMAGAKTLTASAAEEAFLAFGRITTRLIPVKGPVLERVWGLRHSVTPYDAAYVAVAEHLDVPLVTGDVRLASASGPQCEMRVLR